MQHALITITNSPYGFGGVSAWIERMTKVLPKHGWRITLLTHALDEHSLADWATKHPLIEVKPILGRFPKLNQIEPALETYLERERPNLVIVSCSYWMVPTIQRLKQRGKDLRVMGVAHADSNAYYDGMGYYRNYFDHAIGVSQTCSNRLLALGYPAERVSVLPYGVPCLVQTPKPTNQGPLRLAYVGRLVQAQKRIFDFVPLVEALNVRQIDYQLSFYGSGEDEASLRQHLAAIDKDGRITFHGWVPTEQVATEVWPKADVFLLLSDYEGLSISMLEAMGHGVVPVVSRVESGTDEVVQDGVTGYSFSIGDMDACADLIGTLNRDREHLANMSRNAWSLVKQGYSIEFNAGRLAEILNAVMARPPRLGNAPYMGVTAHPLARLVPGSLVVRARRLIRKGNVTNEGFTVFP